MIGSRRRSPFEAIRMCAPAKAKVEQIRHYERRSTVDNRTECALDNPVLDEQRAPHRGPSVTRHNPERDADLGVELSHQVCRAACHDRPRSGSAVPDGSEGL